MDTQDLNGAWRAREGSDELHTEFLTVDFDDHTWCELPVPGHWRASADFAAQDGPLLYRRRFPSEFPGAGRRFLRLGGACYFADVWLDGVFLGSTEGYFAPQRFEVTEAFRERRDHTLAIEVASPPLTGGARRTLLGSLVGDDADDHAPNPGGLWRSVGIESTGAVSLSRTRVLCSEATESRGRLHLDCTLDVADGPSTRSTMLRAVVRDPDGEVLLDAPREVTPAEGTTHLRWDLDVEQPPRWWPWRLGAQPLCTLELSVLVDGTLSDRFETTVAFRAVRFDDWTLRINGERLFVMGAVQGPVRHLLATAYGEEFDDLVRLALAANLDLLRVRAHVSRPELYDAADRYGLLLWQDLPLLGRHTRSSRRPALHQARELVDHLGHHPSIAMWCAHDEPFIRRPPDRSDPPSAFARARAGVSRYLPSWNKDVLDRSVAHGLRRADPTRTTLRHSGVLPGVGGVGTDTHVGTTAADARDLARRFRRVPNLARFVTARGLAPAVSPAEHAAVVQLQIEDLRRLMHRPTGGFAHSAFADDDDREPAAVLNPTRVPTAAYVALRDACRTVLPMLEPRSGHVHVANTSPVTLTNAEVSVTGYDATGAVAFGLRFAGDVTADDVTYVGRVPLSLAAPTGSVVLALTRNDGVTVTNRYGPDVLQLVVSDLDPA